MSQKCHACGKLHTSLDEAGYCCLTKHTLPSGSEADVHMLMELTAKAMNCELTMAAITESLNEDERFPFKKTIEFDALGILMGVDVQGNKAIHRLKVDDLASLSIEDAEDELQERLVEGLAVFQGFAARVYEEPERAPGCFHNGGCDC